MLTPGWSFPMDLLLLLIFVVDIFRTGNFLHRTDKTLESAAEDDCRRGYAAAWRYSGADP